MVLSIVSDVLVFHCPGCRELHGIWVTKPNPITGGIWTWNGDLERPTVSPSLLLPANPRCHAWIKDGQIAFLPDCDHHLAGQTVPMLSDPLNQPRNPKLPQQPWAHRRGGEDPDLALN